MDYIYFVNVHPCSLQLTCYGDIILCLGCSPQISGFKCGGCGGCSGSGFPVCQAASFFNLTDEVVDFAFEEE